MRKRGAARTIASMDLLVEGFKRYKLFGWNAKDGHTSNANTRTATLLNGFEEKRFSASWHWSRLSFRDRVAVYSGGEFVVKHFSNGAALMHVIPADVRATERTVFNALRCDAACLRRNRGREEEFHFHKFLPIVIDHVAPWTMLVLPSTVSSNNRRFFWCDPSQVPIARTCRSVVDDSMTNTIDVSIGLSVPRLQYLKRSRAIVRWFMALWNLVIVEGFSVEIYLLS